MSINSYIENLFAYLDRFEKNPADLDTEAFLQTYNGIYAVFQTLRKERDRAVEIDQFFLGKIKQTPLSKSDLRLITVQLLISYFEVESDVDGQSNQAYLYCRGQREVKQDVPYFENHLVPRLFADGSLGFNRQLKTFFLGEIARYMNRYGSRVPTDIRPEDFDRMSDASKFLLLARRRLELGRDLITERGTLEHDLAQIDAFKKLAARGREQRDYLADWGYLTTTTIWSRIAAWFSDTLSRIGGAFKSWRYFRLVIRQRSAALAVYSLMILLAIVIAIWVPSMWMDYSNERLEQLEQHADELRVHSSGK